MPTRLSILGVRLPEQFFRRQLILPLAALLIGLLVLLEWTLQADFSLGVLYIIPIAIAGTVLNRVEIILLAIACAFLRGMFTPSTTQLEYSLRFLMATIAFSGVGLFVVEMSRNRRVVISYYAKLKLEQDLRRQAEEQLRILAESSPAAILTLDHEGVIVAANRAAAEMLAFDHSRTPVGQHVGPYIAALANALKLPSGPRQMRASAWTWARKTDGTMFPIAAWFSTYGQDENRHLAAIVVDVSEEVRDRERENFRHLLDYNRLLAGAVSHEIRNMCSAASVVCAALGRRPELRGDADFLALAQLVEGLGRIASFELHHRADTAQLTASLPDVLDQLRIIIMPDWQDAEAHVSFEVEPDLPPVKADSHGLLQIFLNLAQNSLRAVQEVSIRELTIRAVRSGDEIRVSFIDSGPGVVEPGNLFQAFRPDSDGSGLGLYISRMLARNFDGNVVHVPRSQGCQFDVTLKVARRQTHGRLTPVSAGLPENPAVSGG
jgi:two-component system sensor kinase FixL